MKARQQYLFFLGGGGRGLFSFPSIWPNADKVFGWVLAIEQMVRESSVIPLQQKTSALERYREAASGKSNAEARDIAKDIIGSQVDWDWDCTPSFIIVDFSF
jgi:isocitrate lyase